MHSDEFVVEFDPNNGSISLARSYDGKRHYDIVGKGWVGREVTLWVGLTMWGYPKHGTVSRWIPTFPGGAALQVDFPEGTFFDGQPLPFVCVPPEWVFPRATPKEPTDD